jgi:hypothetical protein
MQIMIETMKCKITMLDSVVQRYAEREGSRIRGSDSHLRHCHVAALGSL